MIIKETENMLETRFLNLMATHYIDNNKCEKIWMWCQRPNNTKAVVIVAVIDNGFSNKIPYVNDLRIVVIKERRVPLGGFEYGFPAGLVEDGEDPVEAAKRELLEETGLTVKKVIRTSPYIYNSAGMTDESISMVYVECECKLDKSKLESSEDIETFIMTRGDVEELLKDKNKMFGAKAWIVLSNFVRYNEI